MERLDDLREQTAALIGVAELTSAEVAHAAGMDLEQVRRLWRALGFPPVPADATVFTRNDVAILATVRGLLDRHTLDFDVLVQLTRVTGQSLSRVADAQVTANGIDLTAGAVGVTAPELERLIGYVWRRHLVAAILRRAANPSAAEETVTVGFADLVGFTALSQALEAHELAAMVDRFETMAYEHIPERAGRVVKMIGDEVMFAVDDAVAAAEIALALVEAHGRDADLPDVRVGLARGPVLTWEGDLYGPTVNLASRLVALARPATVLVSDALGHELRDAPGFAMRHLRPVRLQGIGRVRTWALRRAVRA